MASVSFKSRRTWSFSVSWFAYLLFVFSLWGGYNEYVQKSPVVDGQPNVQRASEHPTYAGRATRYGEGFQGLPLGCGGGTYDSGDSTIAAAPESLYGEWACGDRLNVCGWEAAQTNPAHVVLGLWSPETSALSKVRCITVVRVDSCPGCDGANVIIDLSDAALWKLCGRVCDILEVTVQEID